MYWALCFLAAISLQLEHARTEEEIRWGLMGREELEGAMLFHLEEGQHTFWMLGCKIDLDLAFLDREGRVVEVHQMEAHPEVLDRGRPIHTLDDLKRYPECDPICRFFARRAVRSRSRVAYALEAPAGWLSAHGIEVGTLVDLEGRPHG